MDFICPSCRGSLIPEDYDFVCSKCSHKWHVKDGIPCFTERDYHWDQLSVTEMGKLNYVAKEKGWLEALHNTCHDPNLNRYIIDEDRANWLFTLPTIDFNFVLDLGAGWGTISIPLSRFCKLIFAGDASLEHMKFVNARAKQSHIDNLKAVCLDAVALPFPDSYFDLVVLNGVFEWVGVQRKTSNPLIFQKRCLCEVHRVLKKGKVLYVGIENRYGGPYLLGFPDSHTNLPFTSVFPRRVSNLIMRLNGKGIYETYTHSIHSYRSMLTEVGFTSIDFSYIFPHCNDPIQIVSLHDDNDGALRYCLKNVLSNKWSLNRRKSMLLAFARFGCWFKLGKYLWPYLSIIAVK